MTHPIIRATELSKSYPAGPGVSDLSWEVGRGTIAGLVGPNGAGKTTVIKMLLGVTRPTSGTVEVLGRSVATDPIGIRRRVALVPEDKLLYGRARASSFLRFYGSWFPAWDLVTAERLLAAWRVPIDRRIAELSKGNRAKLALAAALSRGAELLLLDEPTIDLDPASVEEILGVLTAWVADESRAIVLATHRLEEVERVCDRMLVMSEGRAVLEGNVDDIKDSWRQIRAHDAGVEASECLEWPGVVAASGDGALLRVVAQRQATEIAARLRGAPSARVEVENMSLREIYLTVSDYERGRLDGVLESLV